MYSSPGNVSNLIVAGFPIEAFPTSAFAKLQACLRLNTPCNNIPQFLYGTLNDVSEFCRV